MSWIKIIPYEKATGKLKRLYDRVKGPNNTIDNVLAVHSLRPHTLNGHMVLYKSVLHNRGNTFPKWYLELLGTYVSKLNQCDYCFDHHSIGLKKNLADDRKFNLIMKAIAAEDFEKVLTEKQLIGCQYAQIITQDHTAIDSDYLQTMRTKGFDDGEILEVNQLVSYFNYVNRMVVGLGVNTKGDILGLSPNDDSDNENWTHQ